MSRKRRMRPDEEALWKKVASNVEPMHPLRSAGTPEPMADIDAHPAPLPPIKSFEMGSRSNSTSSSAISAPNPAPAMDDRQFRRMKRGKLAPEATLDLHGDTQNEAHGRLNDFVQTAYIRGLRLVLVITGKGRSVDHLPYPHEPRGVLRRQVPIWLRSAPLGAMVLETREAHIRHGGGGALYVYLRRRRGQRT